MKFLNKLQLGSAAHSGRGRRGTRTNFNWPIILVQLISKQLITH